jgi:signal transduction histidine kinase
MYGDRMTPRWGTIRPSISLAVEMLVAAALLAGSLIEIWVGDAAANGWGGPRGLATALAVVAAATVVGRHRRPLVHAAVGLATAALLIAVVAPRQGPFEPFVALALVFYSVAAHAPPRHSAALLAIALAAGLSVWIGGAQHADVAVPALVWLIAAWVIGQLMRARGERTRLLEELTVQLVAERDERARAAVTQERARIARELHDVVAHNVSIMVVHAGAGARTLDGDQPVVREALSTIETVGRQTVDEMRRLLGILRDERELAVSPPPSLKHLDLLVQQARGAGLDVTLTVTGDPAGLAAGVDLAAYRIVQEALTNALKHAGRARAAVSVRYEFDRLELEIVDDGDASAAVNSNGQGLVGMSERVTLYGGTLDAGARAEGGYRVAAQLPLHGTSSR